MARSWTDSVRLVQPSPGWKIGTVVGLVCALLLFALAAELGQGSAPVARILWMAGLLVGVGLAVLWVRSELFAWLNRQAFASPRVTPDAPTLAQRRMHASVAALGHRALVAKKPGTFVTEAASLVAEALEVDACDIWEISSHTQQLR